MKKLLAVSTVFMLTGAFLSSCGGGGGGGSVSYNGGSSTMKSLTYSVSTTRAPSDTVPVFYSGKPVLVCDNGVFTPSSNTGSSVSFTGSSFSNCVLSLTAGDGTVLLTANEAVSGTGTVTVDDQLNVLSASGVSHHAVTDADGDHVADHCEHKELHDGRLTEKAVYDKTVIVVLEGDNIPNYALTDYLKANYNDLVSGLQSSPDERVKFLVIWDGGLKNGVGSDVFILDPESGKTFSVLDSDIQAIENGQPAYNYAGDGILYWFSQSDNLSVHLKDLILMAARIAPAKSYDLIISDHGDGWVSMPTPSVRSVLYEWYDDGQQSGSVWLGSKQFADVLKDLKDKGINIDLLGFDECLMGEFTTLNLFAPYARVIVASPEYEQGQGWGDVWKEFPEWYSQGLDDWSIAKEIVDGYIGYYTNNPPNQPLSDPQTIGLTAVKTEALSTLRESFEKFAGDLYQTAQNEVDNGQMYEVFYSHFSNNDLGTYYSTLWTSDTVYTLNETDADFQELVNATNATGYHHYYGGSGPGYDSLGADLLFAVTNTGAVARAYQLGHTASEVPTLYGTSNSALAPSFADGTVQDALNFLDVYNQVKSSDQLYTKYLYLDMQGGYDENVTGSGLSLIYPYTSPDYAQLPKLELCDYTNYADSFRELFPNYTNFVSTVFGVLQQAVQDAGLEGDGSGQFVCQDGNAVWNP